MPTNYNISQCDKCGQVLEGHNAGKNCERMHITSRGLKIKGAVMPGDSKYFYRQGDRFPAFIEVWHEDSQKVVVYERVQDNKKPTMGRKRRPGQSHPPPMHSGY